MSKQVPAIKYVLVVLIGPERIGKGVSSYPHEWIYNPVEPALIE